MVEVGRSCGARRDAFLPYVSRPKLTGKSHYSHTSLFAATITISVQRDKGGQARWDSVKLRAKEAHPAGYLCRRLTTMAQQNPPKPAAVGNAGSKKRKEPPTNASNPKNDKKRPRNNHQAKQRDARTLSTQTSSKAFRNGQLDVDNFVKSREYEIRAMEEGMSRSKQVATKRAFQQVPKDLRRRTASHNVKRVPKRLQPRAKREVCCHLQDLG